MRDCDYPGYDKKEDDCIKHDLPPAQPGDFAPKRRGRKNLRNVVITKESVKVFPEIHIAIVYWNCPSCKERNRSRWFGRDTYYCLNCSHATNLTGTENPGGEK